jgi:hypothetical protein
MDNLELAVALRNKAAELRQINVCFPDEDAKMRDAAELVRVLARVVSGQPLATAFGAPGDWGYETPIGAALAGQRAP